MSRSYNLELLTLITCLLLPLGIIGQGSKDKKDGNPRDFHSLNIGISGSYYNFRDLGSSQLAYRGLGGAGLTLGYRKQKKQLSHEIDISFTYGESKPQGLEVDIFTNVYRLFGQYSLMRKKALSENFSFDLGGSISSDALYIVYPYFLGNNDEAYSIDLITLGPKIGLEYRIDRSTIKAGLNIDFVGWNVRPQAYHGIAGDEFFEESTVGHIFNNLRSDFSLAYGRSLRNKNGLELQYDWNFRNNRLRANTLLYAQHSLSLRYYFKVKN